MGKQSSRNWPFTRTLWICGWRLSLKKTGVLWRRAWKRLIITGSRSASRLSSPLQQDLGSPDVTMQVLTSTEEKSSCYSSSSNLRLSWESGWRFNHHDHRQSQSLCRSKLLHLQDYKLFLWRTILFRFTLIIITSFLLLHYLYYFIFIITFLRSWMNNVK